MTALTQEEIREQKKMLTIIELRTRASFDPSNKTFIIAEHDFNVLMSHSRLIISVVENGHLK